MIISDNPFVSLPSRIIHSPDLSGITELIVLSRGTPEGLSVGFLDSEASQILERGCNGFIQKPFGVEALSNKIREVLEG